MKPWTWEDEEFCIWRAGCYMNPSLLRPLEACLEPMRGMERAVLLKTQYDFGQSCCGRRSRAGVPPGKELRSPVLQDHVSPAVPMKLIRGSGLQGEPEGRPCSAGVTGTSGTIEVDGMAWLSPGLPIPTLSKAGLCHIAGPSTPGWVSVRTALVGHRKRHRARNQDCVFHSLGCQSRPKCLRSISCPSLALPEGLTPAGRITRILLQAGFGQWQEELEGGQRVKGRRQLGYPSHQDIPPTRARAASLSPLHPPVPTGQPALSTPA